MSRAFDIETLTRPGGVVPVDIETTASLVRNVLLLRAENESLRWHIETILQACDTPSCGWYTVFETTIDEARAALNIQQHREGE